VNSPSSSNQPPKPIYFNRELSWLAFNQRVLQQAYSPEYPLLERMRYLSFVSTNLDEFFEIRVSGLIQQVDSGASYKSIDGLDAKQQLHAIIETTNKLVSEQYECWERALAPALKEEGIVFKTNKDFTPKELSWLETYFEKQIYPVLTPLAIDPAHPFPQLINKGLNILAWLSNPATEERERIMAVIPVPRILPRVIHIEETSSYVFLSDILRAFADRLFPGYTVEGAWEFRITRNSDLYFDEEEVENLLQKIEEELYKIRRGAAVRLEIRRDVDDGFLEQLLRAIHLQKEYVFRINGPLNLMRLFSAYDMIDRPDLKFPAFTPYLPAVLANAEVIFSAIAKEDILLHHPYESFAPVIDFVQQAARDPQVFAIKQTLYRTSGGSPIVEALKEASRNGKQVTVLVELKARFDEANNISWARQLEEVGVHVVYGLVGLKTHCKCCLVVRREGNDLVRYAHLGTGNYNVKTARSYTDLSLLTARQEITDEVADLFNTLTGFALAPYFQKLIVSPFNYHRLMQEYIKVETENAIEGKPARIVIKINSLSDRETIDNLYLASQAGVQVELIIRGICCLVPGVKGLSENITVRSILGRFLEHSRIYYFENADRDPRLYVGSGDWMPRNFFRRIEAIFPIDNQKLKHRIIDHYLFPVLKDNVKAQVLQGDLSYEDVQRKEGDQAFSIQKHLLEQALLDSQKPSTE